MKYTIYSGKELTVGFGAWDGVELKKEKSKLVSIIGYADSNISGLKFRTYIFFSLRIIKELK